MNTFCSRMHVVIVAIVASALLPEAVAEESFCVRQSAGVFDASKSLDECSQDDDESQLEISKEPFWSLNFRDLSGDAAIEFRIRPSDHVRWPAPVTLALHSSDRETHRILMPGQQVERFRISVPPGDWSYEFEANDFVDLRGELSVASGEVVSVRETMLRLPIVTGVVRVPTDVSPIGVRIFAGDDYIGEIDRPDGVFEVVLPSRSESIIRFEHPGLPVQILELPPRRNDMELPPVRLSRGGTLLATVSMPAKEKVVISLERLVGEEPTRVREIEREGEGSFTLREVLAPGNYRLTAAGNDPLQKHATNFRIAENVIEQITVDILPVSLTIRVVDDAGSPVSNAELFMTHRAADWDQTVNVDANGVGSWQLWQTGDFSAAVRGPTVRTYSLHRKHIAGDEDWEIRLKGWSLQGNVVSRDGRVIPGARVRMATTSAEGQATRVQKTDENGTFEFSYLSDGDHELTVHAEGFREETFNVSTRVDHPVRVLLDAENTLQLRIINHRGLPCIGASVIDPQSTYAFETDDEGSVSIPLERKANTYFIVPREGSFAIVPLSAETADENLITVTVPEGRASIDLGMKLSSGSELASRAFAVRYNGTFLPLKVVRALERIQGLVFATGQDGWARLTNLPVGFYEFWPVLDFARYAELQWHSSAPAAAVHATPGRSTIEMTFEVED